METMTDRIRCRVTAHLPGGAVPGDIVFVDPNDPWMASKIGKYLMPLEPRKRPSPEASQDASPALQEAAGAVAAPPPAETPPEESKAAVAPLTGGSEGDERGP